MYRYLSEILELKKKMQKIVFLLKTYILLYYNQLSKFFLNWQKEFK